MDRGTRNLYWVFWGMGFNVSQCRHLVKTFDRLRLCNLSSGDWAQRLNNWVDQEVCRSTATVRQQLHKCLGIPIQELPNHEDPALFDEDFQTVIEPCPPGRPRG